MEKRVKKLEKKKARKSKTKRIKCILSSKIWNDMSAIGLNTVVIITIKKKISLNKNQVLTTQIKMKM